MRATWAHRLTGSDELQAVIHSYKVSVEITQSDTNKCPDCSCLITESPYSIINCTFPLEVKFFGNM